MEKELKYQELLQQSETQRRSEDIEFQVKSAKLQLSADILETERALDDKLRKRTSILRSGDIDWKELVEIDVEIQGLQEGIQTLKQYEKELF